jgi:hypothetical protein
MKTIGICIQTIEGGVVCHQEIGREAMRPGVAHLPIVTHTPQFEGSNKLSTQTISDHQQQFSAIQSIE